MDTTRVPQPHHDGHDDTIEAHYASLERAVCGCYGGYHYIGHLLEGEDGEEVEVVEAVPCRRCVVAGVPALLVELRVNRRRGGDK